MVGRTHQDDDSGTPTLHVLLSDEDAAELKRTSLRLLEGGYVVSARRNAEALFDAIARLQPDLILIDPLMNGLDFAELARCCRASEGSQIALHSKVLPRVLHGAISFKDVVGVIRKTDDDRDFLDAFLELTKSVLTRQLRVRGTDSPPPAVSGTHLIGAVHTLPFEARVRRG